MALLTEEQRKKRFEYLGLGEYNEENIRKFQKKYLRKQDVDGKYGSATDNALRHVYNVKRFTKENNFSPEEFKCECGGKYCTGYPSYMKKVELKNLQRIRDHYGKPMVITCGLRCRPYNNSLNGSISNSKHLSGYACDFYMKGVTDTLENRKKAIKWIKTLPNHNYTYGNGINSYGFRVSAPYMGNAMHTDTNKPDPSVEPVLTGGQKIAKKVPAEKTVQDKICDYALKIAKDNSYIYVHWKKDDPKTKQCPICHKFPKGRYHGFYCTRFPVSMWHHGGGIAVKCDKAPNNGQIDRIYRASTSKDALRIARNLFGIKDIEVIRSKSGISQKKLKAGDICYYYGKGSTCQHAFLYIGNGYMIDANSLKDGIAKRKAMSCKVAVRYIAK